MAVLPMKKLSIFGLNQNRKDILEFLQRQSCVELGDIETGDDECFSKIDIAYSKTTFENSQKSLLNATAILDKLSKPEKSSSMFAGRTKITVEQYKDTEKNAKEVLRVAKKIVSLGKIITDENAEIIRNNVGIESLKPWKELDVSMRIKSTENTSVFIGTLPADFDENAIKEMLAKEIPEVSTFDLEVVSHNTQQTCIFAVCHRKNASEFEQAMRNIGFSLPANPSKKSPIERIKELESRIENSKKEIDSAEKEVVSYKDMREKFLYTSDYFTARTEKYDALSKIAKSKSTFVLKGFIPEEDCENLKAELEKDYPCYAEFCDPDKNEEIPVKLKNNGFAAPIEGVIESYSLPNKKEFDPSTATAIFYYFLFGLMLSDLAYGLIMVIGCGTILAKFKNMEDGLKNSIKMFLYCGISTAFWGLMFGSFFGDVIEVVGETFFGVQLSTPCLWFKPLGEPMTLLMFSLLLGVIHLFSGLALKFYMLAKAGHIKDAIYDVVFWYFLVGGGIIYFMSMEMFLDISGLGFTLPVAVGNVGAVFAGIGAVGIVLTSGRESKKPAIRFMKGLYGLYGATSYLSDILSYSRLLALGLATGVIASVFNQMGAMGGASVVGVILFILVFLM
ncbi:MAG: V-type ATP synthase subunit I, partial [Clostridia bacterium]